MAWVGHHRDYFPRRAWLVWVDLSYRNFIGMVYTQEEGEIIGEATGFAGWVEVG
jgi:hypothetical protein